MKLIGFLLLPAGWCLTLAAIVLLPRTETKSAFMLAGVAVELLGLAMAARAHFLQREVAQ